MIEEASPNFSVKKMTCEDFLNFSENLSQKLVYRKTNTKKQPWKFETIYLIRVEKANPFHFKYKSSFDPNEDFKVVSLLRQNKKGKNLDLIADKMYLHDDQNPIKSEKKRDLLQLLKYIKPQNRGFFENLISEE